MKSLLIAAFLLLIGAVAPLQANPLLGGGGGAEEAAPKVERQAGPVEQPSLLGNIWIQTVALQRTLVRDLAGAMSRMKREKGHAAFLFALGLCFLYGFLHAAGPGHGKLVVVSYFVGERASWRRGIIMGTQIAVTHVISAIVVVVLIDISFRQVMGGSPAESLWVRAASYGLIAVIGAWMCWRAIRRWVTGETRVACCAHGHDHGHHHGHDHDHDHDHHHDHGHDHGHHHHHHEQDEAAQREANRRGTMLALVAGMVPCTGALLIMLYALANGMVWIGVALVMAISLGMATFMGGLGTLAILGRGWVIERMEAGSDRQVLVVGCLEVLAGLMITGVGVLFVLATIYQVPGVGG